MITIKNFKIFFLLIFFTVFLSFNYLCSETNPEVYFNSGIDKYVKGDYDGSITLFEQTLSAQPGYQKAKDFLLKVLVEATEKQIMLSNYQKAKIYIEKAKKISPDDPKVNELYGVILGAPIKKETSQQIRSEVKKVEQRKEISIPVEKKAEKLQVTEKIEIQNFDTQTKPEEETNHKIYLVMSGLLLVIIIVLVLIFYIWTKKRAVESLKKMEELKNEILAKEEEKFKKEIEKINKANEDKIKMEQAEKAKIQMAVQKAMAEKNKEDVIKQFETTIEEDKILDTITDNLKKEEYSRQIIQKMTISIKTIMNVNKNDALNNISRLSRSNQSRLRYDCVKIIENILNEDTFKILLELLNDSDNEVKKAAMVLISNVCKSNTMGISTIMISKAQKMLVEEKIRNGWIV
jgi:tetratricopeptide (TPR) repeat protein